MSKHRIPPPARLEALNKKRKILTENEMEKVKLKKES